MSAAFLAIVRQIPRGKVASYGQVAWLAGAPRCARHVGRALGGLDDDTDVPWHRVVNARGQLSLPGDGRREQARRLRTEGVRVRDSRVDLRVYGWVVAERVMLTR